MKGKKDLSKLIKKTITDKNGITRIVWVKKEEVKKDKKDKKDRKEDKGIKPKKQEDNSRNFKLIKTEDLIKEAKDNGISWKESTDSRINRMRVIMALKSSGRGATILGEEVKKPAENKNWWNTTIEHDKFSKYNVKKSAVELSKITGILATDDKSEKLVEMIKFSASYEDKLQAISEALNSYSDTGFEGFYSNQVGFLAREGSGTRSEVKTSLNNEASSIVSALVNSLADSYNNDPSYIQLEVDRIKQSSPAISMVMKYLSSRIPLSTTHLEDTLVKTLGNKDLTKKYEEYKATIFGSNTLFRSAVFKNWFNDNIFRNNKGVDLNELIDLEKIESSKGIINDNKKVITKYKANLVTDHYEKLIAQYNEDITKISEELRKLANSNVVITYGGLMSGVTNLSPELNSTIEHMSKFYESLQEVLDNSDEQTLSTVSKALRYKLGGDFNQLCGVANKVRENKYNTVEELESALDNVKGLSNNKAGKNIIRNMLVGIDSKLKTDVYSKADSVKCSISSVSEKVRKAIKTKIAKDFDNENHKFKYKIHGIYEVKDLDISGDFQQLIDIRQEALQDYEPNGMEKNPIKDEFYHGTSFESLGKILGKSGKFRIPKDNTEVKTGSMMGRGVYLADKSSKSMQYCGDSYGRRSKRGTLIVCDASTGAVTSDFKSDNNKTVFAKKGIRGLRNNEWCIKTEEAVVPRYIVDIEIE